MKRRLLRVETERRQSEDMRKQRGEVRVAASRSWLVRAGFRRRPSIMHVGEGAVEVSVLNLEEKAESWRSGLDERNG